MRLTLTVFSLLILAACKQPDVSEVEAETRELRAEIRELREELRALRKDTRELRDMVETRKAADAEAPPSSDAGPAAVVATDAGPNVVVKKAVKVAVDSNPRGATVFLDDRAIGRTPLVFEPPLGASELMLRIEKPGYVPRLQSVRVEEDTKLSFKLAKQ